MTINCCRWTQPDTTIKKKLSSGGREPIPGVDAKPSPNYWTARDPADRHQFAVSPVAWITFPHLSISDLMNAANSAG